MAKTHCALGEVASQRSTAGTTKKEDAEKACVVVDSHDTALVIAMSKFLGIGIPAGPRLPYDEKIGSPNACFLSGARYRPGRGPGGDAPKHAE